MTPGLARVGVVALRVVRQLKRDRRTIGLIVFAPIVLMILFGYALSGEMSGIALGLVDGGGHPLLREHIESIPDYEILYLGSESDAEKLISEGQLDGVRILLDASSLQISGAIAAAVQAGAGRETAAKAQGSGQQAAASPITTRYIFGYDLEMMDTVGPAILGLVVSSSHSSTPPSPSFERGRREAWRSSWSRPSPAWRWSPAMFWVSLYSHCCNRPRPCS